MTDSHDNEHDTNQSGSDASDKGLGKTYLIQGAVLGSLILLIAAAIF